MAGRSRRAKRPTSHIAAEVAALGATAAAIRPATSISTPRFRKHDCIFAPSVTPTQERHEAQSIAKTLAKQGNARTGELRTSKPPVAQPPHSTSGFDISTIRDPSIFCAVLHTPDRHSVGRYDHPVPPLAARPRRQPAGGVAWGGRFDPAWHQLRQLPAVAGPANLRGDRACPGGESLRGGRISVPGDPRRVPATAAARRNSPRSPSAPRPSRRCNRVRPVASAARTGRPRGSGASAWSVAS